jgi:uncharacterized protein (TIGR02996 family)
MSDLARAEKLLAKGDHEEALDAMVAAWREQPYARLADAVEALDAQLGGLFGPVFEEGSMLAQRYRRVAELAKKPRDPRFARVLLDVVRDQPFTSTGSRFFWGAVFSALDTVDDPRVMKSVVESQKGWAIRANQREWLDYHVGVLLASYGTRWKSGPPTPPAADKKLLDAIDRTLAKDKKASAGGGTAGALLAAIYADPEDDGPRAVYADHLTESGDPRGEFITLQLQKTLTAAQKKRMSALLAKHERAWIGPLEPVIAKEDVAFRRGFLSGCKVKLRNDMDVRKYGSDPSWATVEILRFGGTRFAYQPYSSQAWGAWHVGPEMKSLRDVNLLDDASLATLLDAKTPLRIERLAGRIWAGFGKDVLGRLAKTDRLPDLRAIEMMAPAHGWLGKTFFAKNLREIVLGLRSSEDGGAGVGAWVRELGALPKLGHATIFSSRSRHGALPRWTFTRDAKNALSIATITPGERHFQDAIDDVAELPPNLLTELTVRVSKAVAKGVDAGGRAAMKAAAERQKNLASYVLDL